MPDLMVLLPPSLCLLFSSVPACCTAICLSVCLVYTTHVCQHALLSSFLLFCPADCVAPLRLSVCLSVVGVRLQISVRESERYIHSSAHFFIPSTNHFVVCFVSQSVTVSFIIPFPSTHLGRGRAGHTWWRLFPSLRSFIWVSFCSDHSFAFVYSPMARTFRPVCVSVCLSMV